jgi:hypothetical protein
MADFESLLTRWQTAGILDGDTARHIRAWESEQKKPAGLRWQVIVVLILGAILLACGVALFVSAHWDKIGPGTRFTVVLGMVSLFHLGGSWARKRFRVLSTALHAVGTLSTGAAIALVGQIFNIQEHWPAAVLMWAIAALAGWILLIVWAVLYLTFFLGSKRRIAQGILFAVAAIASVVGVVRLLDGWSSWGDQTYLSLGTRTWGWVFIAMIPLLFAVFKFFKSVIPVAAAICFSIALPWCQHIWTDTYKLYDGSQYSYVRNEPNLAAHALVAAFAVFIIWWGVRQVSQALVNLGIVGFAISVGWFYYSDLYDKFGRSLGLIGLGVLFLAGGWALEKWRRNLLAGMGKADVSDEEAL